MYRHSYKQIALLYMSKHFSKEKAIEAINEKISEYINSRRDARNIKSHKLAIEAIKNEPFLFIQDGEQPHNLDPFNCFKRNGIA